MAPPAVSSKGWPAPQTDFGRPVELEAESFCYRSVLSPRSLHIPRWDDHNKFWYGTHSLKYSFFLMRTHMVMDQRAREAWNERISIMPFGYETAKRTGPERSETLALARSPSESTESS